MNLSKIGGDANKEEPEKYKQWKRVNVGDYEGTRATSNASE